MIHQIKDFPHTAFIGIGTNKGDKLANIRFALNEIDELDSSSIENVSSIYETLPMGEIQQENYFNAVIKIKTKLFPGKAIQRLSHSIILYGNIISRWACAGMDYKERI